MSIFNAVDFTGAEWLIQDGDVYVSSIGDDVTGTGHPLNPYKTIQKAIDNIVTNGKVVIGNGNYEEQINGNSKNVTIVGDGEVILNAPNSIAVAFNNFGIDSTIINLNILNYNVSFDGIFILIKDCFILNSQILRFGGEFKNTVFKNVKLFCEHPTSIINNTFITSEIGNVDLSKSKFTNILNSHFDVNSKIYIDSSVTSIFDFCNQDAGANIFINGVSHLSLQSVKSSSLYQVNGLSQNPIFNNPFINDYSLSITSPLINKGKYDLTIGARGIGVHRTPSILQGAKLTNISKDLLGRYTIADGYENASILTSVIDLGKISTIGAIKLFAEQSYETPPNNSIVDFNPQNQAPNGISFFITYGLTSDIKNNTKVQVLWNQPLSIDRNGRGNGDPLFDISTKQKITARYIQLFISLRKSNESNFLVQEDGDCLFLENGSNILW